MVGGPTGRTTVTAITTQPRRLMPLPEAWAALGGIGRSTGYELIDAGKLTRVNLGRRAFITAESLDRLVAELTAEGEARAQA